MELRAIGRGNPDFPAVLRLYEEASPESERNWTEEDVLEAIEHPQGPVSTEILGIYPDEAPDSFCGYFLTLTSDVAVYMYYFAILPDLRGKGIGAKALKALVRRCGDKPLMFDFESIYQECDDLEQRMRRRDFYLRNGFHETGWLMEQNGVELIIACSSEDFNIDDCLFFVDNSPASGDWLYPPTKPYRRP